MKTVEPEEMKEVVAAQSSDLDEAKETVEPVLRAVCKEGDEALRRYTSEFDGVEVEELTLTGEEVEAAYEEVDDRLLTELQRAIDNVAAFHAEQLPQDLELSEHFPGVQLGHRVTAMESAGCYVPGGKAAYPSSAVMTVVPAKVAGVDRVTVCTPPPAPPETVVAADLAGADEIHRVGGAQAVAALAYGTESVAAVDKVVGPGGVYVTAAKALVREEVEIDFLAGPSEVLIVADDTADAEEIALDMAAQAEHGPDSLSILVATEPGLVDDVEAHLEEVVSESSRAEILEESLERSAAVEVGDLDEALRVSNEVAPEHLQLVVRDEMDALAGVRHAGAVFVGRYSPVAAGDYATGANHVLPTAGNARRVSGLDTAHFLKRSSVQRLTREGLRTLAPTIAEIAGAEGLGAHVRSVEERLKDD